jgi:hypothetical protein
MSVQADVELDAAQFNAARRPGVVATRLWRLGLTVAVGLRMVTRPQPTPYQA